MGLRYIYSSFSLFPLSPILHSFVVAEITTPQEPFVVFLIQKMGDARHGGDEGQKEMIEKMAAGGWRFIWNFFLVLILLGIQKLMIMRPY